MPLRYAWPGLQSAGRIDAGRRAADRSWIAKPPTTAGILELSGRALPAASIPYGAVAAVYEPPPTSVVRSSVEARTRGPSAGERVFRRSRLRSDARCSRQRCGDGRHRCRSRAGDVSGDSARPQAGLTAETTSRRQDHPAPLSPPTDAVSRPLLPELLWDAPARRRMMFAHLRAVQLRPGGRLMSPTSARPAGLSAHRSPTLITGRSTGSRPSALRAPSDSTTGAAARGGLPSWAMARSPRPGPGSAYVSIVAWNDRLEAGEGGDRGSAATPARWPAHGFVAVRQGLRSASGSRRGIRSSSRAEPSAGRAPAIVAAGGVSPRLRRGVRPYARPADLAAA